MAKYLLVNRIKDQSVRNAVSKALQDDGRLSFHDVRAILRSALDGDGVTPQGFSDLKAILANAKTLATNLQALRDALGKPVKISSGYGEQLLEHFRKLFHILHRREEYASEQTFRRAFFVAIHRRLTQGTRSEAGQTWCERIWTAIATCEQQGRSVFHFLAEAVTAYFASSPAPSLVPDT